MNLSRVEVKFVKARSSEVGDLWRLRDIHLRILMRDIGQDK